MSASFFRGKEIIDLRFGKTYTFYDLASLTKIIFTTTWWMDAVDNKKVSLNSRVKDLLLWFPQSGVKVLQLLNHSAGYTPWEAFYERMPSGLTPEQAFQQVQRFCIERSPLKRKRALYSDLDFFLLGAIMEKIEKKPLISIWKELKEKFYPRIRFHFNYENKREYPKTSYAPTENCSWRKTKIQGQVHDENAYALGGVAPHAGLFGGIGDLADFGLLLRSSFLEKSSHFVSKKTMRLFVKRSLPRSCGDWALGFMLPSLPNSSSGSLMDQSSFGHTGFTGTSFWYDPKLDLLVCLLRQPCSSKPKEPRLGPPKTQTP